MMRWSNRRAGGIRVMGLAALLLACPTGLVAQQAPAPVAPPPPVVGPAPAPGQPAIDGGSLHLLAGRSQILTTDFDIKSVTLTNPAIADATALSPRELLIDGKSAGTISMFVLGDTRRMHYELVVEPGVTVLEQRLRELFPGEDLRVGVSEGAVVLSGRASTNDVMLRAGEVAQSSFPALKVINFIQLPGGGGSQQVMLQVRFAEVNKRAVEELGLNLFATRASFTARATTGQFPAPDFEDDAVNGVGGLVFSDFLNIFFFQRNQGIGGVLRALRQTGGFQSLAEPNLIAYNGQEASFLSGGEFPIPIVSGNTGNVSVTFKEYGVRLRFRPTIAGDVIRLHVRPEVSALDFNNGVTLSGIRIPALTTRYAETEVELRDGQSFAVAGLLNTIGQEDKAEIPFLAQIPIIKYLFKSRTRRNDTTELLVLVTPRLVKPLNPDEVPPLPTILSPEQTGQTGTAPPTVPGAPPAVP